VKTWSDYVAEAEQYRHYKQRCEQLEADLQTARQATRETVPGLLDRIEHVEQRCEQVEAVLTEICRICGWYATEHAGPDLEVHHALKVELLDIAERALASGGDQR
jgi:hypothetical protein